MNKIILMMVMALSPSVALACGPSGSGMLVISGVALTIFLGFIKSAQLVAKHVVFPLILRSGLMSSSFDWVE